MMIYLVVVIVKLQVVVETQFVLEVAVVVEVSVVVAVVVVVCSQSAALKKHLRSRCRRCCRPCLIRLAVVVSLPLTVPRSPVLPVELGKKVSWTSLY